VPIGLLLARDGSLKFGFGALLLFVSPATALEQKSGDFWATCRPPVFGVMSDLSKIWQRCITLKNL